MRPGFQAYDVKPDQLVWSPSELSERGRGYFNDALWFIDCASNIERIGNGVGSLVNSVKYGYSARGLSLDTTAAAGARLELAPSAALEMSGYNNLSIFWAWIKPSTFVWATGGLGNFVMGFNSGANPGEWVVNIDNSGLLNLRYDRSGSTTDYSASWSSALSLSAGYESVLLTKSGTGSGAWTAYVSGVSKGAGSDIGLGANTIDTGTPGTNFGLGSTAGLSTRGFKGQFLLAFAVPRVLSQGDAKLLHDEFTALIRPDPAKLIVPVFGVTAAGGTTLTFGSVASSWTKYNGLSSEHLGFSYRNGVWARYAPKASVDVKPTSRSSSWTKGSGLASNTLVGNSRSATWTPHNATALFSTILAFGSRAMTWSVKAATIAGSPVLTIVSKLVSNLVSKVVRKIVSPT